jgi:hypothetical protein
MIFGSKTRDGSLFDSAPTIEFMSNGVIIAAGDSAKKKRGQYLPHHDRRHLTGRMSQNPRPSDSRPSDSQNSSIT